VHLRFAAQKYWRVSTLRPDLIILPGTEKHALDLKARTLAAGTGSTYPPIVREWLQCGVGYLRWVLLLPDVGRASQAFLRIRSQAGTVESGLNLPASGDFL